MSLKKYILVYFDNQIQGLKIFEFIHCPFEGRANMHHKIQPNWLTGRCCLAGGSKGQCRKSKIFLSLLLPMQVDQYIFFPETCFAYTISEPKFTVCGEWFKSSPSYIHKLTPPRCLEDMISTHYLCNVTNMMPHLIFWIWRSIILKFLNNIPVLPRRIHLSRRMCLFGS